MLETTTQRKWQISIPVGPKRKMYKNGTDCYVPQLCFCTITYFTGLTGTEILTGFVVCPSTLSNISN